jgi:glycosyltransferase involved in cell wall biosynthesis
MKNIVYIQCSSMYPIGGIDRVIIDLANMLYRFGYDVRLVSGKPIHPDTAPFINPEIIKASNDYHAGFSRKLPQRPRILQTLRILCYIYSNYGLIVGLWPNENIRAILLKLASRKRMKSLISEHCDYQYVNNRTRWICNILYQWSDYSWTMVESAHKPQPLRNFVIPNFISHTEPQPGQEKRENLFIALGHLIDRKNFIDLIRAANRLRDVLAARAWSVEIYGVGPLKDSLEQEIRRLRLEDLVKLCGYDALAHRQLQRSKCLVLCSKSEAFPIVFLEALANGNFIISSSYSDAVRDIFTSPALFETYEWGDDAELAIRMHSVIDNYTSDDAFARVTKANVSYFYKNFSEDVVSNLWRKALQDVFSKHEGRRPQAREATLDALCDGLSERVAD